MKETVADWLIKVIEDAEGRYYSLVLLVGRSGTGKTRNLQCVADRLGNPVINANLILTERLLQLTKRQRALQAKRILAEEVDKVERQTVLLDNIEVLFDPELAQDPMRLLQGLSRNRTIVATWPGAYDGAFLTYAEPGHPEWRRYSQPEASIVAIEGSLPQATTAQHESPRSGAQEKR